MPKVQISTYVIVTGLKSCKKSKKQLNDGNLLPRKRRKRCCVSESWASVQELLKAGWNSYQKVTMEQGTVCIHLLSNPLLTDEIVFAESSSLP